MLVKASGVGVFDEYLEAAVPSLASGKITIFWDVDAPATLDRLLGNHLIRFASAIPLTQPC